MSSQDQVKPLFSGLVEIAALSALVGATTCETLALGGHGAVGLPWVAISSFGAFHLIRACISACTPDWLREVLGVRNEQADAAVGFGLNLGYHSIGENSSEAPIGVVCDSTLSKRSWNTKAGRVVYALPATTDALIRKLPEFDPQTVYFVQRERRQDSDYYSRQSIRDIVWLLVSLLKAVEVAALYFAGANSLYLASAAPWTYFFVSTGILQVLGQSRECDCESDAKMGVLAGDLPRPLVAGRERRILFGVSPQVRGGLLWKVVWAFGGIISIVSLIAVYTLLGKNSFEVIYLWIGFQILWLLLRSLFFYFSRDVGNFKDNTAMIKTLPDLPRRLAGLVAAVSRYQILCHPRTPHFYTQDLQGVDAIRKVLTESELVDSAPLGLDISAVVGDTFLSSGAWIFGSDKVDPAIIYDSCLVQLGKKFLVPAARVLSTLEETALDLEASVQRFCQRGDSIHDGERRWRYFIPTTNGLWIYVLMTS